MAIDDNTSYELTGYQVKDLAQKIRAKADTSSLASVATSGLYSDLTGTPTIPTVNNGKLKIQENGVDVGEFTANQSTDTTINLTGGGSTYTAGNGISIDANDEISIDTSVVAELSDLPTKTSDLQNDGSDGTSTYVEADDLATTLSNYQAKLTAGTNISIDAGTNTISATDTTYSDFTGATSSAAGAAGLVPAPTTSDPDKFLKGDGTWGTPTDTTYSAGTNIQISAGNVISATDTTYSAFTGSTASADGTSGLVPQPLIADKDKFLKGDGTWTDTPTKLVEMAYGESNAWAKFIAAYNAGSIVYCRASSNANPATGAQTRKAFMAYVNNETNPTSVEFQYVRSVSSKTDSQQCDQVFVYTLTNASGGTWSVVSRNMAPKVAVDASLTKTFTTGANATVTIKANNMTGATSSADGAAGYVTKPLIADKDKFLKGDGTWGTPSQPTVNDGTLTIQKNGTTVQTFTANQSGNATANITGPEITMTSTDPGSGSALAADNYIAVYGNSDATIQASDIATGAVTADKIDWASLTGAETGWKYLGQKVYNGAGVQSVTFDIPAEYQNFKFIIKMQVNGNTPVGSWVDIRALNNNNIIYCYSTGYMCDGANITAFRSTNAAFIVNSSASAYDTVVAEGIGMKSVSSEWRVWDCTAVSGGWQKNSTSTRYYNGGDGSVNTTQLCVAMDNNYISSCVIKMWGSNN